jgi:hypothetical protein
MKPQWGLLRQLLKVLFRRKKDAPEVKKHIPHSLNELEKKEANNIKNHIRREK